MPPSRENGAAVRSFLGFVLLVVVLLGAALFLVAPAAGPGVVSAIIRGTPPLAGQDVAVDANVDPVALLSGRIASVQIQGQNLRTAEGSADSVNVTVTGLSVVDRSFAGITGHLAGATLRSDTNGTATFTSVELSGSSSSLLGRATIAPDEASRLVIARLADVGITLDALEVATGSLGVTIGGQRFEATLRLEDGSLVLDTNGAVPPLEVVKASEFGAWRASSVTVEPGGVVIDAVLRGATLR
jgi:hypothetical protein